MKFRLHYRVRNGGDGSASVEFHPTKAAAEFAEAEEERGWGESSVGSVQLTLAGDQLSFPDLVYDEVSKKYEWVRIPLAQESGS
jgi:hypothetical protein